MSALAKRNALSLSTGQAGTSLPNPGVVSVGELCDEPGRLGQPRRLHDLRLRIGTFEGDVVGDGLIEQKGFLKYQRSCVSNLCSLEVVQRGAVDPYDARIRVEEPNKQLGHGRLARSGWPRRAPPVLPASHIERHRFDPPTITVAVFSAGFGSDVAIWRLVAKIRTPGLWIQVGDGSRIGVRAAAANQAIEPVGDLLLIAEDRLDAIPTDDRCW